MLDIGFVQDIYCNRLKLAKEITKATKQLISNSTLNGVTNIHFYYRECNNLEVQVDIESKPSHLCFTSDSSINELLHIHSQSVEGLCHEEKDCLFMSDHSDCLISNTCDVTLAQPESIRSDGNSTDTQSDDVPDISSDECDSPSPIHDRHLEITASDNKLLNTESFECEDYEQTECVLEQGGPQTETVVHYV